MIYDNLTPIERDDFHQALAAGGDTGARALVRMALFESDPEWAEQQCLAALSSPDAQLRLAAVTGAGHLVRRYGSLRPEIVAALHRLHHDGLVGGMAGDALEDVRIFGAGQQS